MRFKFKNPDEIRVGDLYANGLMDFAVQDREEVVETQVMQKAEIDGEEKLTAGIMVRNMGGSLERFISYETLAERNFRVWRAEKNLTEEEKEEIREANQ